MPHTPEQIRRNQAKKGSGLALARLQGMKLRARLDPPRAAVGTFPYPHRTCAEWEDLPCGTIVAREQTDAERRKDAREGSAKLRDAIRRMAA